MTKLLILILLSSLIAACSTTHPKRSHSVNVKYNSNKQTSQNVINTAKAMLGIKYYYGGNSPKTGFDCSGLVYYSHKKHGITLPRTTSGQLRRVRRIYKSALRPGDLVFFAIDRKTVSHVGIYLGNNKFIHSPSTGKRVNITSMNTNYWRSRFVSGGRI